MTLTTPIASDHDAVFPGENWFFYWKTAASLWKNKLEEYQNAGKIYVPINWSFHSETGDDYDFSNKRPETNISAIASIAREIGREVVFFIPVTPAPYLPNGGIPHLLARHTSYGRQNMPHAFVDADGRIHKMFSFFDPRVYQAFRKFLRELSSHFNLLSIESDVYSLICGHVEKGEFHSLFDDESKIFQQSLARFVALKQKEVEGNLIDSNDSKIKNEFSSTIKNLYLEAVKEYFPNHSEGVVKVSFLGATPDDFFDRVSYQDKKSHFSEELLYAATADVLASSVLLPAKIKEGALQKELSEIAHGALYANLWHKDHAEDQRGFAPLVFFEIFEESFRESTSATFRDIGLIGYLDDAFRWTYLYKPVQSYRLEESEEHQRIHIFHGQNLDKKTFSIVIRSFLSGAKVLLNRSGLTPELVKRLDLFYLENNLKVDKVNYHTQIDHISLGTGVLITFQGDEIAKLSSDKKYNFWQRLVETFEIRHLKLVNTQGVDFFWRARQPAHSELRFEAVRRISVYNHSSYKRKIRLPLQKNFALIKIVDQVNTTVASHTSEIDVELMPNGSLSLDFGIFG